MTVSLHPRDLGQVEIRLVRGSDGTTAVTVTASQAGTLQELSQNMHHLHAALDAANIPVDGRTVNFTMASASGSEQDRSRDNPAGNATQDRSNGSGDRNPGQNQSWQQGRQGGSGQGGGGSHTGAAPLVSRRQWQISGLNITA